MFCNIYFLGKKISIFSYKNMMNTFSNGINYADGDKYHIIQY